MSRYQTGAAVKMTVFRIIRNNSEDAAREWYLASIQSWRSAYLTPQTFFLLFLSVMLLVANLFKAISSSSECIFHTKQCFPDFPSMHQKSKPVLACGSDAHHLHFLMGKCSEMVFSCFQPVQGAVGLGTGFLPTFAKFSRFSAVFECWERKTSTAVRENLTKELVQYFNTASYFKQDDNSDKSIRKWVLAAHKKPSEKMACNASQCKGNNFLPNGQVSAVITCIFIKEMKD